MIIVQNATGTDHEAMLAVSRRYHQMYCALHGYGYHPSIGSLCPERPAVWTKLLVILNALAMDENVAWVDGDALIVQPEAQFPFMVGESGLGMCWHPLGNEQHWNAGVIHCDRRAIPILQAAWSKFPVGHHWEEQHALNLEIHERNAKIASLDHSCNEGLWKGARQTFIKAWHGHRPCSEVATLMSHEMNARALWDRLCAIQSRCTVKR